MIKTRSCATCAVFVFALSIAFSTNAQERWSWPENPENLQVLPSDWSGRRLSPVMRGFTRALGVRCSHCHVGEEGEPLTTYNFASDDNPNKVRAREMLRMLGSVNEHLAKIEPSGEKAVNMWCHTCHRGRPRPMTLSEEMSERYRADGIDAALLLYTELRERFYGKGAYNFDENALNGLGYEMLAAEDTEGAIKIFEMNTVQFPDAANLWDSLAEGHMKAGHTDLAIEYYTKTLEMDPDNDNARVMLEELRN